jgi:hypothetical protein
MAGMTKNIQQRVLEVVAVILFVMGVVELYAALDSSWILSETDPLSHITYRKLFILRGILELVVSAFILIGRSERGRLILSLWFATGLIGYRLAMSWYHTPNVLACLGNRSDWIAISPRAFDRITLLTYAFILFGSYASLILNREHCSRSMKMTSAKQALN